MGGSKQFDPEHDYPPRSEPSSKPILKFDSNLPQTFLELLDTFNTYVDHGGKFLVVNEAEDGITVSVAAMKSDKHSAHVQLIASTDFNINHALEKFPSVQAFTTAGDPAEVHYSHTDNNNVRIQSELDFTGTIYIN